MKMTVDVKPILDNMKQQALDKKNTSIDKISKDGLNYAKNIVPVKSGRLKNSIKVEASEDSISIIADTPYANIIEYGGKNRRPSGFMSKTLLFMKREFEKIYKSK